MNLDYMVGKQPRRTARPVGRRLPENLLDSGH